MPHATIEQVAHVLNLTPRRVQQLVKQDGMPRISRGEYDLVKCVHWYIALLTNRLEESRRGSTETESQARARYMVHLADWREMDVLERRGELIKVDAALGTIEPVLMALRSRLLSVPRRISIVIGAPDLSDRIRIESLADNYIRETLDEISTIPDQIIEIGAKKRRKWNRKLSSSDAASGRPGPEKKRGKQGERGDEGP